MLTYQLQARVFHIEEGGPFQFPNNTILEIKFMPGSAFGTDASPSRTLVRAREATVDIDANTGRWLGLSQPPLERLNVVLESPNSRLSLNGDELKYEFQCSAIEELEGMLSAFKWILPPLLNLEFSDPPIVAFARGRVGKTVFRWEHKRQEWRVHMRTVTADKLEQHFASAFDTLPLFNGTQNRRLAAALYYFHVGVRLNVCGDSPWEFMAESILNFSKSLEILFSTSENTKDDIRRELKKLGFTNDYIEGDFIPLLILRSWVDVAHPRVAIFKRDDLKILYKYLALSEEKLRSLLKLVLKQVDGGTYKIPQEQDLSLNNKDRQGIDKLIATMESRIKSIGAT